VARGLAKHFGPAVALARLDLQLHPGQTLAVLGPNGAGKTTLLRMVAGLSRPSSGSLTIEGRLARRREVRGRVGYVGHATLLYPALTARENLVFAGRMYGVEEPEAQAERLLTEEGLLAAADRRVGDFSRGMAQRVAIARALVHDPTVLLLDEPYTGLDRSAAARLSDRIQSLRANKRTLMLVTHDLVRAAALADSVLVLTSGRVVYESRERVPLAELERIYVEAVEAAP